MAKANSKKKEAARRDFDENTQLEILRAYEFEDGNISFDCKIDGVSYYQLTVVKHGKSRFVSEQSHKIGKGKTEKWLKYYWLNLSDDAQETLIDAVDQFIEEEEEDED